MFASNLRDGDRMFAYANVLEAQRGLAMMGRYLVRTDIPPQDVVVFAIAYRANVTALKRARQNVKEGRF